MAVQEYPVLLLEQVHSISSPSCLSKSNDAYKWEQVLLSSKNDQNNHIIFKKVVLGARPHQLPFI